MAMTVNATDSQEVGISSLRASTPMEETLRQTLAGVFGFETYLPGQEAVVTRLVEGKSVLAVFPTGGGKSVCYQLPALLLDGLTVVISPLIALMKDQIDFLVARGVPAARLDSSLTREENLQLFDSLHAGRLKLLYISPERLGNERFLQTLRRQQIALLAIDEAHCISEWGHNFRPDYLKIARLAKELEVQRVLTLTATATPAVAEDIANAFSIARSDIVNTGFYRPNLRLRVTACDAASRDALLLSRLRERPPGPAIVYVTLQRTAEDVAAFLRGNGLDAVAYHAGMETEERNTIQDKFMASDRAIIVATIAFGMGVDKADIRYVYHYNLPKGLESYSQEIGRAGRDGKESTCEMLACAADAVVLENFSYGDTPGIEAITSFVEDVLGRGAVFDVSVYELSRDHDIRSLVVKTLLTYLELENVVESTGPFYAAYKFQPQRPSDQILARFDEGRAAFLRSVFSRARKGKTWFTLDLDAVSASLAVPRQRIMAALGYLEETGDLVVQASGVRNGYRVRQLPADLGVFCEDLNRRFQKREDNDIARIRGMLEFAQRDDCLTRHLLAYFGEQHDKCGHCCRCEGVHAQPLRRASHPPLHAAAGDDLRRLCSEGHESLGTPRQMARFLCGIASPATTRAKLKGHAQFGALSSVPFPEVLALVEQHAGETMG
jgi:ATP-dependent DNA helicase RecQ